MRLGNSWAVDVAQLHEDSPGFWTDSRKCSWTAACCSVSRTLKRIIETCVKSKKAISLSQVVLTEVNRFLGAWHSRQNEFDMLILDSKHPRGAHRRCALFLQDPEISLRHTAVT